MFFNLGSAEPRGSANSLLGSLRILKSTLLSLSRFRQTLNNVSKIPRLEKAEKHCSVIIFSLRPTECVMNLDLESELLIFEPILTTFKPSIVFRGSWGSIENWLEPNQTTFRKFSLPKSVKRFVELICVHELMLFVSACNFSCDFVFK